MALLHGELTEKILASAYRVHSEFNAGLMESAYEAAMYRDLTLSGLRVARQVELPVMYRGERIDCAYRIDLLVENTVVLELKAVEKLLGIHEAQLFTYMRLGGFKVGLLINFNVQHLKDGIVRRVL